IMENGIDGPLPGTILKRCSSGIRELFDKADLIISKGGGNFDTLGEENESLRKIVFMLLSKCRPYMNHFHVPLHHPVLHVISEY
ncbi:MAG: ARMT1-like domain-containing protein, partial [Thermodesulfobacteriota bacterium]